MPLCSLKNARPALSPAGRVSLEGSRSSCFVDRDERGTERFLRLTPIREIADYVDHSLMDETIRREHMTFARLLSP